MAWMEALNALAEHSRRKSTTFYTFVNKTSTRGITEVFICRGLPHYKMSDDGVMITLRNANKDERIFIFEGPPYESDWTWYPNSLVLSRRESAVFPQNITHEELFGIGNTAL
jgi:hypothetical protein|nr:MAG TPA: hypothetical protein [Caudoviricetes sp.]